MVLNVENEKCNCMSTCKLLLQQILRNEILPERLRKQLKILQGRSHRSCKTDSLYYSGYPVCNTSNATNIDEVSMLQNPLHESVYKYNTIRLHNQSAK